MYFFIKFNNNFKIYLDYKSGNVIMKVYDNTFHLIETDTKWSFDMLEGKLLRKLNYLAIVDVEKIYRCGKRYFKYTNITYYKLKDFAELLGVSGKIL